MHKINKYDVCTCAAKKSSLSLTMCNKALTPVPVSNSDAVGVVDFNAIEHIIFMYFRALVILNIFAIQNIFRIE